MVDWLNLDWGPFRQYEPNSITIDRELAEQIYDQYHGVGDVISIRPYNDGYGIQSLENAQSFLTQLHQIEREWKLWTRNVTPPSALELVSDDDRGLLQFRYAAQEDWQRDLLLTELESHYPDAEISMMPPTFMPYEEGMNAAVADLELRDSDFLKPIKNFEDHKQWFKNRDPYDSVTGHMVGRETDPTCHVMIQMVMKPAISNSSRQKRNWYDGWFYGPEKTKSDYGSDDSFNWGALTDEATGVFDSIGRDLESSMTSKKRRRQKNDGDSRGTLDKWTTKKNTRQSNGLDASIDRHRGEKGYHLNIRIIAISPDEEEAVSRVKRTAEAYESFYDTEFQQGFIPNYISKKQARKEIVRAAGREIVDQNLKFGTTTLAGVGRMPVVSQQQADYSLTRADQGAPPRTSRFEPYDQTGYTSGEVPPRNRDQFESDDFNWPFAFEPDPDPDPTYTVHGNEMEVDRIEGEATAWDDETKFAGAFAQATIQNLIENDVDDQPIFLGWDSNGRPVPIERHELTQHTLLTGFTGSGKTTTFTRIFGNHVIDGGGGILTDPGGEDTYKTLMALPPERLDDVIVMDAGSDYTDHRVGINLLDTFTQPGDPGFQDEVDAKLGTLLPVLETDEHPRMKRVSSHILRGLIEANYLDEYEPGPDGPDLEVGRATAEYFGDMVEDDVDDETDADDDTALAANFTIEDGRNIIREAENRQAWYDMCVDHGLDHLIPYAKTLAEMDDGDNELEPTLGRFKEWLESPALRSIVALRQSTISIPDIILNGKILFLKIDSANPDLRRKISGVVNRYAWTTMLMLPSPKDMRRMELDGVEPPGSITHENYDDWPEFMLAIDELAGVLTDTMDLGTMLAEGRKRGLRVLGATQQFRNLDADHQDQLANVGRLISFDPGKSDKEERKVASMFPGIEPDEIGALKPYTAYTIGKQNEPYRVSMFPPMPPRSSFDEIHEFICEIEREYGIPSDQIDPLGLPGRYESPTQETGEDAKAITESGLTREEARRLGHRAFHDAAVARGQDTVTIDEARERVCWYLGWEDAHEGMVDDFKDRLLQYHLAQERSDGEIRYYVEPEGLERLGTSGTGSSSGKGDHSWMFNRIHPALTKHGVWVQIVDQDEDDYENDPDFRVVLPPEWVDIEPAECFSVLSPDGRDMTGEGESSTGETQPSQTLANFAGAISVGERCLFTVTSGDGDKPFGDKARQVHETMTDPRMVKRVADDRTDFYMSGNLSSRDGTRVWRPRTDARNAWWRDHTTDTIVFGDENGRVFDRFEESDLRDGPRKSALSDCIVSPKSDVDTNEYQSVPMPFVPEVEGVADVPDDTWFILVIPDDDSDREIALYADGACVPLSVVGTGDGNSGETGASRPDDSGSGAEGPVELLE